MNSQILPDNKITPGPSLFNYRNFNVFVLPVILIVLTTLFYGMYFETNDDFIMSLLLKGDIQPDGGAYDLSYFFYRYLTYGYSFLYSQFPGLPWYGISFYIFNLAAAVNIFYILDIPLSKYLNKYSQTVFLTLIFFALIAENIIEINFTRTSILLCGSSLLVIAIHIIKGGIAGKKKYIITCLMLYLIAFFIRPMAGLLISALILPFSIYTGIETTNRKSGFYFTAASLLIIVCLYITSQSFRPASEKDIIKYGETVANIVDFDYGIPGTTLSIQDSIKKEAIKLFFVTDRKQISNFFLERMSTDSYLSLSKLTASRVKNSIKYIFYYLVKDYKGMTVLYVFILFSAIILNYKKNKPRLVLFLLIQAGFFSALILINTLMKLPERLFVPLYGMIAIGDIFLLSYSAFKYNPKKILIISFTVLIISSGFSVYAVTVKQIKIQNKSIENFQSFSELGNRFKGSTFIITHPASTLFDGFNSMKHIPLGNNRIFPLIGWTTIMPSYYNELKSICNSSGINDFINYSKNSTSLIFISNNEFNTLLSSYFKILYGNELHFVQLSESPELLKKRNLYLFRLIP